MQNRQNQVFIITIPHTQDFQDSIHLCKKYVHLVHSFLHPLLFQTRKVIISKVLEVTS